MNFAIDGDPTIPELKLEYGRRAEKNGVSTVPSGGDPTKRWSKKKKRHQTIFKNIKGLSIHILTITKMG